MKNILSIQQKNCSLEKFNKETLNNLKQKNIKIINNYNLLIETIKNALEQNEKQINFALGAISECTKNKIENEIGQKIFKPNQYCFIINYDSIIHIAKHFKKYNEIANILLKTVDVISNFNDIKIKKIGNDTKLIFENYNIRTVETLSNKNNSLNLLTIYYIRKNRNQVLQAATSNKNGSPNLDSGFC